MPRALPVHIIQSVQNGEFFLKSRWPGEACVRLLVPPNWRLWARITPGFGFQPGPGRRIVQNYYYTVRKSTTFC